MEKELSKEVKGEVGNLISQALEKGADIEVMERLFSLQEKWERNQAKKEFDLAMSKFQGKCPTIAKTKDVKNVNGMLIYAYAPIDSIVSQVKDVLSECGLSYTFKTEINGEIKVICIIKHLSGHQEDSGMIVPKSNSTKVNSPAQAIGGDVTFAKRYAFCNALGIMTGDEDVDAIKEEDIDEEKKKIDACKNMDDIKKCYAEFKKTGKHTNKELIEYANEKIQEIKEDIPVIKQ